MQPRAPTIQQLTHDSLQTSDTVPFELTEHYEQKQQPESVASPSFSSNHAVQVTETTIQQTVGPYASKEKTPIDNQKQVYTESYALEVSNTTINEMEAPFEALRPDSTKCAGLSVVTSDHVSTIETQSGESTAKFYPELIVATEVAKTNVNSLNEYKTEVVNVMEPQEEFDTTTPEYRKATESLSNPNYIIRTQPLIEGEVQTIEKNLESFEYATPKQNALPVALVETTRNYQQAVPESVPLDNQKESATIVTEVTQTAAIIEESFVLESITDAKPTQPYLQKAAAKSSPNIAETAVDVRPDILGKISLNIFKTQKHITKNFTHRHHTHNTKPIHNSKRNT